MGKLQYTSRRLTQSISEVPIEIKQSPILSKKSKVFTIGSCFAVEIRDHMISKGYNVLERSLYDTKRPMHNLIWYNSFSILYEFERAAYIFEQDDDDIWALPGGRFQDPYRRFVFGNSKEDLLATIRAIDSNVARCIKEADCIVITLGLTEVWFQNSNDRAICGVPGYPKGKGGGQDSYFRFTDYDDNYDNMVEVVQILSQLNPKCNIVITVSPVALAKTFMGTDQLIANTESKSILRAVAGALSRECKQVHYFHAYELAMNGDRKEVFYRDGRHINSEYAAYIVGEFERFFVEEVS